MASKRGKGGAFERRISRELSLWWSDGEHDDLFWRSSQSGGRATTRSKTGRRTIGQYGDIAATCPESSPLTEVITVECKFGYSESFDIQDLIDKPPTARPKTIEIFISQCVRESEEAETPFWILISKRNNREPCVIMPSDLSTALEDAGALFPDGEAWSSFTVPVRTKDGNETNFLNLELMRFDTWCKFGQRKHFSKIHKEIARYAR